MRTFLFERELMLLDEPFGALDALTRSMMQRWLLNVWQRHRRTISVPFFYQRGRGGLPRRRCGDGTAGRGLSIDYARRR